MKEKSLTTVLKQSTEHRHCNKAQKPLQQAIRVAVIAIIDVAAASAALLLQKRGTKKI